MDLFCNKVFFAISVLLKLKPSVFSLSVKTMLTSVVVIWMKNPSIINYKTNEIHLSYTIDICTSKQRTLIVCNAYIKCIQRTTKPYKKLHFGEECRLLLV